MGSKKCYTTNGNYFLPLLAKILPISGPKGLFFFTEWIGKETFWQNYFGINIILITAAAVSIVSLVIPKIREKVKIKPYFVSLLYLLFYVFLLYIEVNPLASVVNWPRAMWAIPLVLGTIIAAATVASKSSMYLKLSLYLVLGLLVIVSIYPFNKALNPIRNREGGGYVYPLPLANNLSKSEIEVQKLQYTPSFVETSSKQERLYSLDDRFNMWWSSYYDLPLVRGYFPGLTSSQKEFYLNQIDTSIFDNRLEEAGFSRQRAENVAHFYLDWYSIRYIANTGRFSLSSYLDNNTAILQKGSVQGVEYLELNNDIYSPILVPTNTPTLCFLGSDNAYNYLMRALARFNLNSNIVIPLKGPRYLEFVKKEFLQSCDSLMIYDAKILPIPNPLRSRALKLIGNVIEAGKSIFIESGETGSFGAKGSLPSFFPTSQATQEPIESWKLTLQENSLFEEIDPDIFSPPTWEGNMWKLSLSKPESIRSWANIILEHDSNPTLVAGSFGKGTVIWSGLNLLFHMDYYSNDEEAKLLHNIVNAIIPQLENNTENIKYNVDWVSPEKRTITTQKTKGVIFKESNYKGWKALTGVGDKLTLYSSGPNQPGFIYTRLLNHSDEIKVTFEYSGSFYSYFIYLLSLGTLIYLLDMIIFKGKFISNKILPRTRRLITNKIRSFSKSW